MLNPPAPVRKTTTIEKVARAAGKVERSVSRNRDIAILILGLVLGYLGAAIR